MWTTDDAYIYMHLTILWLTTHVYAPHRADLHHWHSQDNCAAAIKELEISFQNCFNQLYVQLPQRWKRTEGASYATIALWRYPHVKWEIELLSQITTTAPIFLQFNYFRQKYLEIASSAVSLLNYIWVRVEHSLLQKLDLQKVNCSSSSLQAGCE